MGNFNGIPYFEPLQRLNQAFPNPKPGETILLDMLRAIVQAEVSRFNAIIAAWMKQLRSRGLKPTRGGKARGIGIWFATERDETHLVDGAIVRHAKGADRILKRARKVDPMEFSEMEKSAHNLRLRNIAAHAKSAELAAKDARRPPPPPVSGDNVRLLKKA